MRALKMTERAFLHLDRNVSLLAVSLLGQCRSKSLGQSNTKCGGTITIQQRLDARFVPCIILSRHQSYCLAMDNVKSIFFNVGRLPLADSDDEIAVD